MNDCLGVESYVMKDGIVSTAPISGVSHERIEIGPGSADYLHRVRTGRARSDARYGCPAVRSPGTTAGRDHLGRDEVRGYTPERAEPRDISTTE